MAATPGLEEDDALVRLLSRESGTDQESENVLEYELNNLEVEPPLIPFPEAQRVQWYPVWRRRRPQLYGPGRHRIGLAALYYRHKHGQRRSHFWWIAQFVILFTYGILTSIFVCGAFFPSYSHPPQRYYDLRTRVLQEGSSANIFNEKIFIVASLYDHQGELLSGQWAEGLLYLIDILGRDNVFLSIYENDPDEMAQAALDSFAARVPCENSIVSEDIDLAQYPHVTLPDGTKRLKRITFLADVRNRALRPLEDANSTASRTQFDKLLYLNDVIFDPIQAANLLFSTNVDEDTGRTQYRAACSTDFINPFKFYDTFATRDLEGYDMGVPFYPWFSSAGQAESRQDVLDQKDAVRVKSCWGGMIAFEAKWFQMGTSSGREDFVDSPELSPAASMSTIPDTEPDTQWPSGHELALRSSPATSPSSSLRFRYETETFRDSSECCLIHADLLAMDDTVSVNDTGIYMNPYIRVAYSSADLPWLTFTKRFEKLYPPIHAIANWIAARPTFNARQFEEPGDEVVDRVWAWDDESMAALKGGNVSHTSDLRGHFIDVRRKALPGGFCGVDKLSYINEGAEEGEPKWGKEDAPIDDDEEDDEDWQ